MFLEINFFVSFTNSFGRFSEFGIENIILFQIKVFCRKIKENTLARYFMKVTARLTFM